MGKQYQIIFEWEKKILKLKKKNVKYLGYKECGEGYENFKESSHCSYSYILCTLKKKLKIEKSVKYQVYIECWNGMNNVKIPHIIRIFPHIFRTISDSFSILIF